MWLTTSPGMDWECPSFNYVLGQQLTKYWGNITAPNAILGISSVEQSGDNRTIGALLERHCVDASTHWRCRWLLLLWQTSLTTT